MIKKVLYLGPKGSYTDLAKERFSNFFSENVSFIPEKSINRVIKCLKDSNSEELAAVIPIENSIEGIVRETLDNLFSLAVNDIRIMAETRLSIEHSLIGFGKKSDIKTIISHPQALAQCREYIYKNFNSIVESTVLSTSAAVSSLKYGDISVAAIGNNYCASLYDIPIIESNINDEDNNTTRFILLSKIQPKISAVNKVSITFSTENKAGALKQILDIIDKFNLNMSYIDSRPSRKLLGEYIFFIDFEGHINNNEVSQALIEIKNSAKMFEILSNGAEIII